MLSGIVYEKLISALIAARESTLALRAGNSEQENLKSEGKKKKRKQAPFSQQGMSWKMC